VKQKFIKYRENKLTVARYVDKQLNYRRETARRLKSVEILSAAAQL